MAPIGGVIKTFTVFPLFYMKDFKFVKQSGTSISVVIDNRALNPKKIPIAINGTFVYLSRYSREPVISKINDNFVGELIPITPHSKNRHTDGNMTYEYIMNDSHYEIKKVIYANSRNSVAISFSPPFPDMVNLVEGVELIGKFSMETDTISGIVAGEYKINATSEKINVTMNPTKAYSPMMGELWVLSYRWIAEITKSNVGSVNMNSKWFIDSKMLDK